MITIRGKGNLQEYWADDEEVVKKAILRRFQRAFGHKIKKIVKDGDDSADPAKATTWYFHLEE
jgi:hypothetical protein